MRNVIQKRKTTCGKFARYAVGACAGMLLNGVWAAEEWSGSDLTIYGSTSPASTYIKTMNNETLSAGSITIGTEKGSAALVAVDSTVNATGAVILGHEKSPGYASLTAAVALSNTTMSCAYVRMGNGAVNKQAESLRFEIGPGSVVKAKYVERYSAGTPVVVFTGGRLDFSEKSTSYLFLAQENSWNNTWPNGSMEVRGAGFPIDLTVDRECDLVQGQGRRGINFSGNGGLVKRGSGTLRWVWRTLGWTSTDAEVKGEATYSGDTVIKEGGIKLVTPSSASKAQTRYSIPPASPLKIEKDAFFDFAGNDAAWVSVSGEGVLQNTGNKAATLTLGADGGPCQLSVASCSGAINVVKTGAGKLVVNVPQIEGDLLVSNGVLKVAPGTTLTVKRIVAEPGTTLDFRGAKVVYDELVAPPKVNIRTDSNTPIDSDLTVDEDMTVPAGRFSLGGTFSKRGPGTLTLLGPAESVGGAFCVGAGKVTCVPAPTFPGKYFRILYRFDASRAINSTRVNIEFSEMSFYGVSGGRINQGGFTYTERLLPSGSKDGIDDATELAERELAVWMPNHNAYFSYPANKSPIKAFDGDIETSSACNGFYVDADNNVVFRMEDDAPDAIGMTFTTASSGAANRPTEWIIHGSVDGKTWTELMTHTAWNCMGLSDGEKAWAWRTNTTPTTASTEYNGGVPYLFDGLSIGAYLPFGDAAVSVAPGATLEITSDFAKIGHLAVDLQAGAGTISCFNPVENGVLDITSTESVPMEIELPLAFGDIKDKELLRTWTIKVNGEARPNLRLRVSGNKLKVTGGGLVVVFK